MYTTASIKEELVKKIENEQKEQIKDKVILIIDDVITTGATTSELARVLIENGAKACHVLTFAHSIIETTSN